ncbi:WD domain, G-beta repeat, putative [Leishmania lindenbergi]|uniref:WD domain, G-beta repeat n=1 Tax=Leishmania lindenbergi TaxID=651832 RepID=A0AAW3AJ78_9TRYP
MRLNITSAKERHSEACTTVAVSLNGDIISGSDDFTVRRWNANGEALGVVKEFESCVTFLTWVPTAGRGSRLARGAAAETREGRDNCLVACADGSFSFLNTASGRVERTIEAHIGSITATVYAADGSSIITAGEDGCVKVWSQAGIPRTTLANVGRCINALCWGKEATELGGDCVLYAVGSDVVIKPLNPAMKKQIKWKAHKGVVLCADWSRMSGMIVTGGEDGVYKVWDPHGCSIFVSAAGEHPVTSVRFAADGESFAVGSFMNVRVCDKTGWSHSYERTTEGSAMALDWMPDGTQMILGNGTGALSIAQIVDRKVSWGPYSVTLLDSRRLTVQDVVKDTVQEIELADKVIKVELGCGYLVVCTTTQCCCYSMDRLNAPVQFDLRDPVISIILGLRQFLLADCSQGLQVFSYEGRQISVLRLQVALKPDIMTTNLLSLSPDTVAMRDPADASHILFFDVSSGKLFDDASVAHHLDIVSVHLSQSGSLHDRKIAFIDRNNDLYFGPVHTKLGFHKLSTMTTSVSWHDAHETLVAIADGHLATWYYPSTIFTDRDLLSLTKTVRDDGHAEFTRNDRITHFHHTRVLVRRGGDGALLTLPVSPYPVMIFQLVTQKNNWEGATRLARFLKDQLLWAVLTALALRAGELNVAEIGYGALSDLAKVRYIHYIKGIPTPEARQAELALLQHRPAEAERILLQAGLVYRCIDMCTRLFRWERALEIAKERKTHLDTVLGRRERYLQEVSQKETLAPFKDLSGKVKIDWAVIEEKVKQEAAKELERPNARPYA